MNHLDSFEDFINEQKNLRRFFTKLTRRKKGQLPEEDFSKKPSSNKTLSKTNKLVRSGFKPLATIRWEEPNVSYVTKELHEILGNIPTWAEVAPQVLKKLPKTCSLLRKTSNSKDLTKVGEILDSIKKNLPTEVKEELQNFILKNGRLVSWNESMINKTGNMGGFWMNDATTVDRSIWGKGESLQAWKFNKLPSDIPKGEEGMKRLIELMKKDEKLRDTFSSYLITYKNLLKNESLDLQAPWVVNVGHYGDKQFHCIGGHKRSTVAIQLEEPLKVWLIEL
jgi:hypothetical protein